MSWQLYLVEHPSGTFIGVARNEEDARIHFGAISKTTRIPDEKAEEIVLDLRAQSRGAFGELVFLAI